MKSNNILVRNWLSKTAILVFGIMLLQSCEKDEQTIGLEVLPGTDALSIGQDTTYASISMYDADSIRTDELAQSWIGNYFDPVFGQSKSEFYCQLELPGNSLDLGLPEDLVLDSIVLSLKTTQNSLGSLNPQQFSVYTLTQTLFRDSLYYSDDTAAHDGIDLIQTGENEIIISDASLTNRGDILFDELRFPLDNSLGQLFLDQSGGDVFDDDDTFQEFFKGLAVVSNSDNAAMIGIDPNSSQSAVHLYYRDLSDMEDPDTTDVSFQIDNSSAYFNHFERDYSTATFGEFMEGQESNTRVYLQGIEGISSRLEFADFPQELIGDGSKTLALARLVVPVNADDNSSYDLPFKIYLNSGTNPDSLKIIADEIAGLGIGGFYDDDERAYIFNCTLHMQAVISGEIDLEPLWLSVNPPGPVREFLDAVSIFTSELIDARRVVLNGSSYNPQSPSENMRLELTFSE